MQIIEPPLMTGRKLLGRTVTSPNWGIPESVSYGTYSYGSNLLLSQGHPGPPYRSGGPFAVIHVEDNYGATGIRDWVQGAVHLQGCFVPKFIDMGFSTEWLANNQTPKDIAKNNTVGKMTSVYSSFGPAAVKRFRPDMPTMGLAQFVAELRDLPRLPFKVLHMRNQTDFLRQLGSEYLNVEFGWKPLLKDLRDLLNYRKMMDRRLSQLLRDNGKVVRRRGTVDSFSSSSSAVAEFTRSKAGSFLYGAGITQGNPVGVLQTDVHYEREVWFAGAFQFYIDNIEKPERLAELERAVAGLRITPALLWELAPWSWLIDWFSSVGDSLSNIYSSVADRSVMRYGYLMCTETWTAKSVFQGQVNDRSPTGLNSSTGGWKYGPTQEKQLNASRTRKLIRKSRIAASPYGFGINLSWETLSDSQKMILVALGLSSKYNK